MIRYVLYSKFKARNRKWKPDKPKYGYANRSDAYSNLQSNLRDYPKWTCKIVEEEHPDHLFENGKHDNKWWGN